MRLVVSARTDCGVRRSCCVLLVCVGVVSAKESKDMAMVLGAFVPDTAAQWRKVVEAEVARQLGVAAEARKLAERLERVGAALGDAEARAARGDEASARWLAKVRAAAYEADGAVDRCRVAARWRRGREKQHQHQVRMRLLLVLSF